MNNLLVDKCYENNGVIMSSKVDIKLILLCFLLTGCSNLELNENFPDGPVYVKKTPPPAPIVIPEPEPEPEPEPVLSVAQQNSQAIGALTSLGFEAEESDKGVVVYLPPNIHFERGGAGISLEARSKLAEISAEVNKDYLLARKIEVSDHSDTVGGAEINLNISKQRAETAAEELVFSKVAQTRLIVTWFGEERPRFPDYTAAGVPIPNNQALNRRVEFTILNPGS